MICTMIDLETMGTGPNSAICAIGAVKFDPDADPSSDGYFYKHVSLSSSQRTGGTIDADTVEWWLKQSDTARSALTNESDVVSIEDALFSLDLFHRWERCGLVWAAPAHFDIPIIESAFQRCRLRTPWDRKDARCWSTLRNVLGIPKEQNACEHHALEDAKAQVAAFRKGWAKIRTSCQVN